MSKELYPGERALNARDAAEMDAAGKSLYTPAEILVTRERLGLTRVAFGEMLGVSERAVARWERGERNMFVAYADRLTELIMQADSEVWRLERELKEKPDNERTLIVYRSDEHLREHEPDSSVTAGWIRAIAGRAAEGILVDIQYAP